MPALESLRGKIGPYRLHEKIGEGGMGMVYLASDTENRPVAVKVLGPAVSADPNARQRLFREVETMRRVHSPYVAEVLDADVNGSSPYIVTRYVPGRTLEDIVRTDGPLQGIALERLATGLARALAAIHAAGVVHRDLKPGNVMIADGHPVVIDFGIAHIPDATRLTQTGMVMGTPGYLAPEVIEGHRSTSAVDIHAWGATVAFAATGRQPYGTGTYQTIFFRVLQGKAEVDGVPAPLLPLVTTALAVDPAGRPPAAWLAQHCALLSLNGSGPAVGPNGTRLASASVPWWNDHRDGAPPRPAEFSPAAPEFSPRPAEFSPPPAGSRPARPARPGRAARAARRRQTGYPGPGPAEAAAGVADLLPPVDYVRRRGLAVPSANGSALSANGSALSANGSVLSANGSALSANGAAHAGGEVAGQGLVLLAFGVAAVALAVLAPVAGTVLALAVITLLRAADRAQAGLAARRSVRGARPTDILVVVVTAPWAVVRALLTTVLLAPLALLVAGAAAAASVAFAHTQTLPWAGSWAAGAAVAWYAAGPGSGSPRRQLRRITGTVVRSRASLAAVLIACWALAIALASSALSQPPLIWPATSWMLPHVLPSMGGSLHAVQKWLLRNTVGMLHLP